MTEDGRLSPQGMEALRSRFQEQSRKAQAYYAVMHRMRDIAGNDEAASAWMEKPLSEFGGKTPSQLVAERRTDEVLAYINTL